MKTNYEKYKELIIKGQYNHCEVYEELMGMECHCRMGCDDHCFTKVIEWLNKPYQPPKPKLTLEEKVILSVLPKEFEWIARDEDGELAIYDIKPYKNRGCWASNSSAYDLDLFNHLFQFIQWTDEETGVWYISTNEGITPRLNDDGSLYVD